MSTSTLNESAPSDSQRMKDVKERLGGLFDRFGLLPALIVLFVLLTIFAPNFMTADNLLNVLRQVSFVGIIAAGMTFVIIAAEIDISVGSATALWSVLFAQFAISFGFNIWVSAVLVLMSGLLVGAFAGWVRNRFGIPSFIVTLALYSALRGVALLVSDARPISVSDPAFRWLGTGSIVGVPVPAIIMVVIFVALSFVARSTSFGRSVYAVGGNHKAARLAGINVGRVRVLVFCLTGVLAAVSGVLITARVAAGTPSIGVGLEFDVISAVIVGGASLFGGRGTLWGTFLGVLFIGLLNNGMVLMGVNPYVQDVARGAIVLIAVIISVARGQRE